MWWIETMTLIISRWGYALEDSDSDACRTGIVDIIRMAIDVMCIIREDYRIPHVEHGGGRSLAQSTVAWLPLVRGRLTSRGKGRYISCQPITSSVSSSLQPPTFLSSRLVQLPISSDLPSVQSPTSSDLPSVYPYLFRLTISTIPCFFRLTFSSSPYFFKPTISTTPYLFRPTISTTPYLFSLTSITTSYIFKPTINADWHICSARFTTSHSEG